MSEADVDIELRFGPEARGSVDMSLEHFKGLSIEVDKPREPLIAAVISITAAAIALVTELIKLRTELKSKGKEEEILIVKLNERNEENSLALLKASDEEIKQFISG